MGGGYYSSEGAGWASKRARKALEEAGRAFEAIGRFSKTARKAYEAAGRASEAAGGHFGGQRMKLA